MKDVQAFKRFQECPEAQEQCIRLADGAQRNDLQANTALCTYVDSVDQNATVTNTFAKGQTAAVTGDDFRIMINYKD